MSGPGRREDIPIEKPGAAAALLTDQHGMCLSLTGCRTYLNEEDERLKC